MRKNSEKDQRMAALMQDPRSIHSPAKVGDRKRRQFEARMNALRTGTYL